LQRDGWLPDEDSPWRSLAEVVLDEARALVAGEDLRRQRRFARGTQVIDLHVERGPTVAAGESTVFLFVHDISELAGVEASLGDMQSRLLQKQRVSAISDVTLGVAHDLGNLVGALQARLSAMQGNASDGMRAHVDAVRAIVEAQNAILGKLRARVLHRTDPLVPVDLLAEVIRPAIQMAESRLRARAGGTIGLRVDGSLAALPAVRGVRDDLVNVVMNLLLNAADAMPWGGTVHLGGEVHDQTALLWVEDEGTGIPDTHLGQIFKPLFTTKGAGGTGMGLANAREVLAHAGGSIVARNRPRGGARFELRLRIAAPAAQPQDQLAKASSG
jgi:signal transduction histidine kinase